MTPPTKKSSAAVKKAPAKKAVAVKATPKAKKDVMKKTAEPKPAAAPKKEPTQPKIRIRLSAFDHTVIDEAALKIVETAERSGAVVHGPIPLPTNIRKFTVNRSTFVHKDAREQFEMRIHKRLIDILNPSPKVIEALTNLNLPSGVTIDVKMV